jgi:hypothetical protein
VPGGSGGMLGGLRSDSFALIIPVYSAMTQMFGLFNIWNEPFNLSHKIGLESKLYYLSRSK